MESTGKKKKKASAPSALLAPGFRFHPTDEELFRYYLRRKVCGKSFLMDAISDIDIYKAEPWDLPSMSKLRTRDLEWYFFSMLDRKYGNGAKTNRATEKGYWKTTGKDRAVYRKSVIVGMKKTLVYHNGRAPKGQRSNWVMHEYRLLTWNWRELEFLRCLNFEDSLFSPVIGLLKSAEKDAFVLCRVFQKSGSGPKNGEQYGAPFVEEEWEDEELESVLQKEVSEEVDFGGDFCLDDHDLEQIIGSNAPSHITTPPLDFQSADGNHGGETTASVSDTEKLLVGAGEQFCEWEPFHGTNLYDLLPSDMNVNLDKREYIGESSKSGNPEDVDFLLDELFLDSSEYFPIGEGGFIETSDRSNPVEGNKADIDLLEEYLTFFDTSNDNPQFFAYDPSIILSEDHVSSQTPRPLKELNEGTEQGVIPGGQITDDSNVDAASSSRKQVAAKCQSDFQSPFIKQASQMLSKIPAEPAFASEFPSKDSTLHVNFSHPSSSPVHVTAGMIQIQNLTVGTNATSRPFKHGNLNITVAFGFYRGDDGSPCLQSSVSIHPGKNLSSISRDWFYLFLGVLVLSTSFKMGLYLCAN